MGTDGLPAAIRNLVMLSQDCVDAYNRREEVILARRVSPPGGESGHGQSL